MAEYICQKGGISVNKFIKITLVCAAVCLVLGIVLLTAGFFLGGRISDFPRRHYSDHFPHTPSSSFDTQVPDSQSQPTGNSLAPSEPASTPSANKAVAVPNASDRITQLDFDFGGAEIFIVTGDAFDLSVEGSLRYQSRVVNGEWKIETSDIDYPNDDTVFTVTVPRDTVFQSIELSVGAGILHADALSCSKAEFEVGAGSMDLDAFTCTQECSIEIGAGNFELTNGALNGQIEIECGLGTADLQVARPESCYADLSASLGCITFDGTEYRSISDHIIHGSRPSAAMYEIECSLGTIDVEFS